MRAVAHALAPMIAPRHAGDRLRQGHRARHPQVHDRGDRRMRADRAAGDPVRPELCRRRGARPADRGDARGARRGAGRRRWPRRSARATFRPYHSTDVRGVEIGGAAKNVLAIAAGIVTGRGLGASAAAALTTRGFAELLRFGRALRRAARDADGPVRPGRPGPDLLEPAVAQLLASASRSARADKPTEAITATGSPKARSPRRCWSSWREAQDVDMPIAAAVAAVLDGRLSVDEAIESLLTRPSRERRTSERWPTGC